MYCISKAALNALTIQMNYAFKSRGIIVNSVSPGWVRTDMGGKSADLSLEQGAETPVWLATEAPDDLTGLFWREKSVVSW
jgi:NAD(P)-dependent dehydrogenase (short-subunit alcohol dehydrogenase family)